MLDRLSDAASALRDAGAEQLAAVGGQAELAETRIARIESENARLLEEFFDAVRGGLDDRAERVGTQLEGVAKAVAEAAALVQSGGAEMSGVAEMFGEAVDRQQQAANAWLESLGEVEAAVDRAGRGAAAESLRAQLSASEEVFTRQLDFQRELFEQLRALRAALPEAAAGESFDAPELEEAEALAEPAEAGSSEVTAGV
jgi:DNA-binding ferritin-like protein